MITAPIMLYFASLFARDRIVAAAGGVWDLFCRVVSTPIGAALIAGLVCLWAGHWRGHHTGLAEGRAEITASWDAANAKAARDAALRDAMNRASAQAEANAKLAAMRGRMAEAEEKVGAYEKLLAAQPVAGACLHSADDVRRLRSIAGAKRDAAAGGGFASRLRGIGGTRAGASP